MGNNTQSSAPTLFEGAFHRSNNFGAFTIPKYVSYHEGSYRSLDTDGRTGWTKA